jgi:endogenous inhibitor of DNA gyrase (YacG/DUF329 family)
MTRSPTSRQIACPQCGKLSEWRPENKWRPFCSERCKLIDLGCWAREAYRLPVQEQDTGIGSQPDAPD